MRRMHEIYSPDYAGIFYKEEMSKYEHDPELKEAFKAGYKCGLKKAVEELEDMDGYGERNYGGGRGNSRGGYASRGGMGYREDEDWDEYGERRRRSARTGRYI